MRQGDANYSTWYMSLDIEEPSILLGDMQQEASSVYGRNAIEILPIDGTEALPSSDTSKCSSESWELMNYGMTSNINESDTWDFRSVDRLLDSDQIRICAHAVSLLTIFSLQLNWLPQLLNQQLFLFARIMMTVAPRCGKKCVDTNSNIVPGKVNGRQLLMDYVLINIMDVQHYLPAMF